MPMDRIVEPSRVAQIIRDYLGGAIDGLGAAHQAMEVAGSTDRILAGHQTPVVVAAYWALRRLAESAPTRPPSEEMTFLLDCIEGRRRFPRAT